MPCADNGESEYYERRRFIDAKAALDNLADKLCRLCGKYKADSESWPFDIQEWWAVHQALDELRGKHGPSKTP